MCVRPQETMRQALPRGLFSCVSGWMIVDDPRCGIVSNEPPPRGHDLCREFRFRKGKFKALLVSQPEISGRYFRNDFVMLRDMPHQTSGMACFFVFVVERWYRSVTPCSHGRVCGVHLSGMQCCMSPPAVLLLLYVCSSLSCVLSPLSRHRCAHVGEGIGIQRGGRGVNIGMCRYLTGGTRQGTVN